MRARFTDKYIQCVLGEISEIEKGNSTNSLLWTRCAFWDRTKRLTIQKVKSNIENGYISSLIFSLKSNGNWICDSIPHYSFHAAYNPDWFFDNGYVEIINE